MGNSVTIGLIGLEWLSMTWEFFETGNT